jgi:hypothetical protein
MRRGRIITVVTAALAALMLSASAMAASPRQIYADLADNGRLDSAYNPADLQNAALSPSVEGYGGVVVEQLAPTAAVAGAQKTLSCAELKSQAAAGDTAAASKVAAMCAHPATCAELKKQAAAGDTAAAVKVKHLCGTPAAAAATLPFTGAQLSLFLVIGLALVSSGVLLRRTAKEKSRP